MKTINPKFLTTKEIQKCLDGYILQKIKPQNKELNRFITSNISFFRRYKIKNIFRKLFLKRQKDVSRVDKEYTQVWSTKQYPGSPDTKGGSYHYWNDEYFILEGWASKRVHLLLFSKVIEATKPKNYIEIGSGNGVMLMMLSLLHPNVNFVGLELTQAGVNAAKNLQKLDKLPDEIIKFIPRTIKEPKAFKKVKFIQGNACNIPFNNNHFDFVSTSLALEQMAAIQNKVLEEIIRISKGYIGLLEPFKDFNVSKLQKIYTSARDYLSLTTNDIEKHNDIKVISKFSDYPQKLIRGTAYLLAKKIMVNLDK